MSSTLAPGTTVEPAPRPAAAEERSAGEGKPRRRQWPTATADVRRPHHRQPEGRAWLWLPALVAALPALAVAVVELTHLGTPATPGSDWALLARDADRALGGHLSVGPYSRFGWNHPGPALAYWLAPFWWVSGRNFGGLGLGAAVLSAVTMASTVVAAALAAGETAVRSAGRAAVLAASRTTGATPPAPPAPPVSSARRAAERRTAWVGAAVLVAFAFAYGPGRLREPWNPATVILPLAAVAVFGAAVAAGRRWWLPAWAVAASFAVQTHLGSIPVVVAIVLATWILGTWSNRGDLGRFAGPCLVALAATTVMWALPLHQQVTGQDGNLTAIIDFFRYTPSAHHTWAEVREPLEVLGPLTVPRFGAVLAGQKAPPRPAGTTEVLIITMLAAGLVAGLVSAAWRRDRFRFTLAAATAAAVPATIFAAFRVQEAIYPYLVFYAVSVGLLAWLSVCFTVADESSAWWQRLLGGRLAPRHGELGRHATPPWRRALGLAGPAAVVIVALIVSAGALSTDPSGEIRNEPVAASLSADARLTMRTDGDVQRVVVDMNQQRWGAGAAIVRDLEAHGYDVTIAREWAFLFGDESRTDGTEQRRLVVAPTGDSRYPARPEDQPIASEDGVTLYYGAP